MRSIGWLLRCSFWSAGGKSLLMLLPSEREAMLKQLEGAKVPLKPLKINPNMTQPVSPALQALLSKNSDLKACPITTAPLIPLQEALTASTISTF